MLRKLAPQRMPERLSQRNQEKSSEERDGGLLIGGTDEKAAIALFGTFFLISLAKALWHALRREFAQHREWMIRGYAIGLAVATIRPIMGTFFATAVIRGHTPN